MLFRSGLKGGGHVTEGPTAAETTGASPAKAATRFVIGRPQERRGLPTPPIKRAKGVPKEEPPGLPLSPILA